MTNQAKDGGHAIRRRLAESVNAGVGRWLQGQPPDPRLGAGEFEYTGPGIRFQAHTEGFAHRQGEASGAWRYDEVLRVIPMKLSELGKVKPPEGMALIRLETSAGDVGLSLPLKLYSVVLPLLLELCSPVQPPAQ